MTLSVTLESNLSELGLLGMAPSTVQASFGFLNSQGEKIR